MTENPQEHQGGPDEVPTDESLEVEGPNESGQPSGAPGLEGEEPPEEPAAPEDGNG